MSRHVSTDDSCLEANGPDQRTEIREDNRQGQPQVVSDATVIGVRQADVSMTNSTTARLAPPSSEQSQYVVAEEYTVGVPLVRPNRSFLEILRLAGATGEVFTRKEICNFLKDYIGSRKLYDVTDPRIVYCDNDPLEKVFGLKKFTIDEVLGLINKNCYLLPDTCIKRKRHLMTGTCFPFPQPGVSGPSHKPKTSVSQASASLTIEVCKESPVISSTTDPVVSTPHPVPSTKQQSSSTVSLGTQNIQASKKSRKRKKSEKDSSGSTNTPPRKRQTSLSVTYSDNDATSYPWYFKLKMDPSSDDDDNLSLQAKETATPKSSVDDLWFVDDSISVEIGSDRFSVEYDLESETDDSLSNSNEDNVSGKEVVVVCNESDVEFWADSSEQSNETDTELSEADKWKCNECNILNSPVTRYCERCWKLRPGWLPDRRRCITKIKGKRLQRSNSAPEICSSSDCSDSVPVKILKSKTSHFLSKCLDSAKSVNEKQNLEIKERINFSEDSLSPTHITNSQKIESEHQTDLKQNVTSKDRQQIGGDCKAKSSHLGQYCPMSPHCIRDLSQSTITSVDEKLSLNRDDSGICMGSSTLNSSQEGRSSSIQQLLSSQESTEVRNSFLNYQTVDKSTLCEELSTEAEQCDTKVPSKDNLLGESQKSSSTDVCIVCLFKPKTGCIIHGSTGHQVCCYRCARRLKRQRQPCPVCRRPIQKVVKNFIL